MGLIPSIQDTFGVPAKKAAPVTTTKPSFFSRLAQVPQLVRGWQAQAAAQAPPPEEVPDPDPYMDFLSGAGGRLAGLYEDASRNAQAQYDAAVSALQARREAATQQVAGITPRLNDIYRISNQAVTSAGNALGDAQRQAGLQSYLPPEAIMGPLGAASAQQQAAQESTVPLLQAGFADLFERQRGGLEQAKQAYLGDLQQRRLEQLFGLDERQAEYLARRQQAEAEAQGSEASDERGFQRRLALEEYKEQLRRGRPPKAGEEPEVFGKREVGWDKGESLVKGLPKVQVNALRATPAYKTLLRAYRKEYGKEGVDPTADMGGVLNMLLETARGRPWDRTVSLFMFDHGIDPVDEAGNPLISALLPAVAQAPAGGGGGDGGGGNWLSSLLSPFKAGLGLPSRLGLG